MKKINIYITAMFSLGLMLSSCSDFTDGINTDPNNFPSAAGTLLIGQANLEVVKLSSSQASRLAGTWTDQFTGTDRQFLSLDSYTVTSGDFDDEWDDVYVNGLREARLAEIDAVATGDIILEGVAQILQGLMFGEATALWGDIPFTEALSFLEFPNPSYDSQAFVFEQVQDLLSSGIENVGDADISIYGTPVFVDKSDSAIGVEGATWAEIAHSLKARYYMITKNYDLALTEARLGISSRNADLLSSHSASIGAQNIYYQFVAVQRAGDLGATDSYLKNLVSGGVPRVLLTPGDSVRDEFYFEGDDADELNTSDDGVFAEDASFPIISYYETKLIEAEAAHRTGGDALTPFNEVRSELALQYGADFPASVSTGDVLLNEILEEKYITLIGSLQVFHDARRTENLIGIPIKNSTATKLPQRFLYPQNEINANTSFPGVIELFSETEVNM